MKVTQLLCLFLNHILTFQIEVRLIIFKIYNQEVLTGKIFYTTPEGIYSTIS